MYTVLRVCKGSSKTEHYFLPLARMGCSLMLKTLSELPTLTWSITFGRGDVQLLAHRRRVTKKCHLFETTDRLPGVHPRRILAEPYNIIKKY